MFRTVALHPQQCPKCESKDTTLQIWTSDEDDPTTVEARPLRLCNRCGHESRPESVAVYGSLDFSVSIPLDRRGRIKSVHDVLEEVASICRRNGIIVTFDDVNIAGADLA